MHPKLSKEFAEIQDLKGSIFDNLRKNDPEILQKSLADDKWTTGQIIGHLILAERSSLAYLKKKIKAGDKIPTGGLISGMRMLLLRLIFKGNFKFKAPTPVADPPSYNNLDEAEKEWNKVRDEIKSFLEEYPNRYIDKLIYKHPIVGRIKLDQAIEFFGIHISHHQKQLQNIQKMIKAV